MRRLTIKPHAEEQIYDVAEWIAEKNLPETGIKFIDSVYSFLLGYCKLTNLKFPLCNNAMLAKCRMSCVVFKSKWVVAFTYTRKEIVIHEFIWGAKLH
jgi:hypothetical protein